MTQSIVSSIDLSKFSDLPCAIDSDHHGNIFIAGRDRAKLGKFSTHDSSLEIFQTTCLPSIYGMAVRNNHVYFLLKSFSQLPKPHADLCSFSLVDSSLKVLATNNPRHDKKQIFINWELPYGLYVDRHLNFYVTDFVESKKAVIFISNEGFVRYLGTSHSWRTPCGITVDTKDNIYVADAGNSQITIIDADGNVKPIRSKSLLRPADVCLGPRGDLFVTDMNSDSLIRFDLQHKLISVWGNGRGYCDGNDLSKIQFIMPFRISVFATTAYVIQLEHSSLRKIELVPWNKWRLLLMARHSSHSVLHESRFLSDTLLALYWTFQLVSIETKPLEPQDSNPEPSTLLPLF